MLSTLELIGVFVFIAAVLGAGFMLQRLDSAIGKTTDDAQDTPAPAAPVPPAPSLPVRPAGRRKRRRH
jgi:hypothetical protein